MESQGQIWGRCQEWVRQAQMQACSDVEFDSDPDPDPDPDEGPGRHLLRIAGPD